MTRFGGVNAAIVGMVCAFAALPAAVPAAAQDSVAVRVEDTPCALTDYCERVTRQVQRYFRPPAQTAGARGEVCFRIQRDGSVTEIETHRVSGGDAAFRLALMEAVQTAGSRSAFGPLPEPFDPARWRWCVELTPR